MIVTKENLECGCFGLLYRERIGMSTLARDTVLMGLSVVLVVFGSNHTYAIDLIAVDSTHRAIATSATLIVMLLTAILAATAIWPEFLRHVHRLRGTARPRSRAARNA